MSKSPNRKRAAETATDIDGHPQQVATRGSVSPKRAKAGPTLQEALVAIERETWERTRNGDWEYYEDLMIDGGYAVFPDGVFSKEQSVGFMKTGPKVAREKFVFEEVKVIDTNPDSAILVYKATSKEVGKDEQVSWNSTVFVKRDGKWKVAATHWMPAN